MPPRTTLTDKFDRAIRFARTAHANDVRKGTDAPYLSHLLQVAGLVLEYGGSEDEAIGALLHDAAEDAGGEAMLARIEAEFGAQIASYVRENSDSLTPSKSEKAPWRERKTTYIEAIAKKTRSACLISLADKLHNARSLVSDQRRSGDSHWLRFNAGKADSQWYYRSLVEAFRNRMEDYPDLLPALEELDGVVRELEAA